MVLKEKLLEVRGDDVTQEQAFAHANDVLKNAGGGISDIIHIPGLVNVDFADVKTVMRTRQGDDGHGRGRWPRPRRQGRRGGRCLPVAQPSASAATPTMHTGNGGQVSQVQQPQHTYEGLNTPSVWRTNRTHAAAKVDALASNGMDEIEIPALLRKQAD